jgi:hypothetical protein
MSKIFAVNHFETQEWVVEFQDIAPDYAELFIGFTDITPIVEFSKLKFKYELKQDGNTNQHGVYPLQNTKYVRTDQEYIVSEQLNLAPEQTYELHLWSENAGEVFETTVDFNTPRPVQPFSSWTWDGEKWNPPVPYPVTEDVDTIYTWYEETQTWVENIQVE